MDPRVDYYKYLHTLNNHANNHMHEVKHKTIIHDVCHEPRNIVLVFNDRMYFTMILTICLISIVIAIEQSYKMRIIRSLLGIGGFFLLSLTCKYNDLVLDGVIAVVITTFLDKIPTWINNFIQKVIYGTNDDSRDKKNQFH